MLHPSEQAISQAISEALAAYKGFAMTNPGGGGGMGYGVAIFKERGQAQAFVQHLDNRFRTEDPMPVICDEGMSGIEDLSAWIDDPMRHEQNPMPTLGDEPTALCWCVWFLYSYE